MNLITNEKLGVSYYHVRSLPPIRGTEIGFDIETQGLTPWDKKILSMQIEDAGNIYVITEPEGFLSVLPILQDPKILKIIHNSAFESAFMRYVYGIEIVRIYDPMLAERILFMGMERGAALEDVVLNWCKVQLDKSIVLTIIGRKSLSPLQMAYGACDVKYLREVKAKQVIKLKNDNLVKVLQLEHAVVPAFVDMYTTGIPWDGEHWAKIQAAEAELTNNALHNLLKYFPHIPVQKNLFEQEFVDYNFGSPEQMVKALQKIGYYFEDSSERTLKAYWRDHPEFEPLFKAIETYRKHKKASETEYEKYRSLVTGRLHPDWKQLGARSGRIASSDPNAQNFKAEDDVRSCVRVDEGRHVMSLDYSQIELVVMAVVTGDKNLREAVASGLDIHYATAKILFQTDNPTKEQRREAKTDNFAIGYGSGAETFSITAGISLAKARENLELWHSRFPGVNQFFKGEIRQALARGYSTTKSGRRRYIERKPGDDEGDYFAMLKNNPVQGLALDVMKTAMAGVYRKLPSNAHMIMSVHDEIVCEVDAEDSEELAPIFIQEMKDAAALYLDLPVKVGRPEKFTNVWQK